MGNNSIICVTIFLTLPGSNIHCLSKAVWFTGHLSKLYQDNIPMKQATLLMQHCCKQRSI
ncbi:hypothetical protein DJ94_4995 [Bacillus pseudomycoides]|nr:hypothetical protein DJ94_4995 [Bacillus pseudomycoides]